MKTLFRCTQCEKVFGAEERDARYRLICPHCGNVMESPLSLEEEVFLQKKKEGESPPPPLMLSSFRARRRFVRSVSAIVAITGIGLVLLYLIYLMLRQMFAM